MTERPYITCRELVEFLDLYLEGELPPDRTAEFERHLSVCEPCVRYISTYRTSIALGKEACRPGLLTDADVPEELVTAILSARPIQE
jgi:anti-sigma factor RsiW